MGQNEILDFLITLRYSGDHEYYSPKQIAESMRINPTVARRQINRLYAFGYLDIKNINWWNRFYRVKNSYCRDAGLISDLKKDSVNITIIGKRKPNTTFVVETSTTKIK